MDLYKFKSHCLSFPLTITFQDFAMNAGEILQQVDGLTHDKLTYLLRAGYIKPKKIKRGSLYYNNFSEGDFF